MNTFNLLMHIQILIQSIESRTNTGRNSTKFRGGASLIILILNKNINNSKFSLTMATSSKML